MRLSRYGSALALCALALCIALWLAPPRGAEAAEQGLVDCLDETRGLVLRTLPWECPGRVLTAEEAARWRGELRQRRLERLRRAERSTDAPGERPLRTGTGFRVDRAGHVLTNRHVVEGCRRIRLRQDAGIVGEARVLALDQELDLALLGGGGEGAFATFAEASESPAGRLGAVGYPAIGVARVEAYLAPLEVAPGYRRGAGPFFSFLGTVRAGNSGSPLLDPWGRVVGMATAKRDRVKRYAETGALPPAGGIALSGDRLLGFLARRGIEARTATREAAGERDFEAVLEEARAYVVRIDCWP